MDGKQAVKELVEEGVQVDPQIVDEIDETHVRRIKQLNPAPQIVNEQLIARIEEQLDGADAQEPDDAADAFVDTGDGRPVETSVRVETAIDEEKEKRGVQDFVAYYNDRYEQIKDLLLRRRNIQGAVSLTRLEHRNEGEEVSAVGMVVDKYKTSSGKFIVNIEDPTGRMKLLVDEEDGEKILEDEVIGVNGSLGDDIIFANEVIWPDVPLPSDIPSTDDEVYAGFISDMHFGSIDTLNDELADFVTWLDSGNEFVEKVKYLFITGDPVEGVGTYPGQKEELEVTNIYDQYERFSDWVKQIPDDIQVIIGPGNHDMVRLAEPQPALPQDVLPDLYEQENVHFVPNPAWVNIHFHNGNGIDVLMYHGYSFDEHVSKLQHLREVAYKEPEHAMIDYLKRRHLAPLYGSNLLVPDETDHHVIDKVPDIFCMGHTHSFACTTYKGVNVICSGTFQAQTDFQKRVGHEPEPGKVAFVNLATRESTVKTFYEQPDEDDEGDE